MDRADKAIYFFETYAETDAKWQGWVQKSLEVFSNFDRSSTAGSKALAIHGVSATIFGMSKPKRWQDVYSFLQ